MKDKKKEDGCKACGSAKCEAYDWCQCCGKCRSCGQAHQPYQYPWWYQGVVNIPSVWPVNYQTVYPEITWTTSTISGNDLNPVTITTTCAGCHT